MTAKEEVKAQRRQQILEAAMVCFARKGYYQATTDDIAAECGVSKGTLYWYFKSKKEIFMALIKPILSRVEQDWERLATDPQTTATAKLEQCLAMVRFEFDDLASFFGIMMEAWALTRHDQDVQELVQSMYEPFLEIMTGIIEEGINKGEFQARSAAATALVITTLFDGLTLAKGLDFIAIDWDQILDAAEALIFNGLGVDRSHGH